MKREDRDVLTTVKGSLLRHPLVAFAAGATLLGILALNVAAFVLGLQAPWLPGVAIIGDMLATRPPTSTCA